MPVPKKPNRRRHKKTRHVKTTEELVREENAHRLRRNDQAVAIRDKIVRNVGDVLDEIPPFISDLTHWVRYGGFKQGKYTIESIGRTMEWVLHNNITRVPEVWIRSPDNESGNRNAKDASVESIGDGGE